MSPDPQTRRDHSHISRGSWIYISGLLIRLGARLPMLLIAGRIYGASLYGEFLICLAVVETASAAATLGFKRTLFSFMQESVDEDAGAAVRHALVIGVGGACILSILLTIFSPFLATLFGIPTAATKLAALSWTVPPIVVTELFLTATFFNRRLRYDIWARCIAEPGTQTIIAIGCYAVGLINEGLAIAYAGSIIAAALTATWGYSRQFGLRLLPGPVDVSRLRGMLSVSSRTAIFDLIGVLMTRLDMFVVGHYFAAGPVGLYGMAQQFMTLPDKVGKSFVPVVMPVLSQAMHEGDLKRTRAALGAVAIRQTALEGLLVVAFIVGGSTVLNLIGKGFDQAATVLTILAVGILINDLLSLAGLPLVIARPSVNPIAAGATLIFYLGAVAIVQDRYGIEGIAAISVTAALVGNLYRLWACRPILYPASRDVRTS